LFGYDIENSIDIGEITPPDKDKHKFEKDNPLHIVVPN
jgi:hypothetical protein